MRGCTLRGLRNALISKGSMGVTLRAAYRFAHHLYAYRPPVRNQPVHTETLDFLKVLPVRTMYGRAQAYNQALSPVGGGLVRCVRSGILYAARTCSSGVRTFVEFSYFKDDVNKSGGVVKGPGWFADGGRLYDKVGLSCLDKHVGAHLLQCVGSSESFDAPAVHIPSVAVFERDGAAISVTGKVGGFWGTLSDLYDDPRAASGGGANRNHAI